MAEDREHGRVHAGAEVDSARDLMWLRYQEVVVFCGRSLHKPAIRYLEALQAAAVGRPETNMSLSLVEPKEARFAVAPVFQEL